MITLGEIALELCESYGRVSGAYRMAGVTPVGKTGRTLLFNEADISRIKEQLAKTPKRQRIKSGPMHTQNPA